MTERLTREGAEGSLLPLSRVQLFRKPGAPTSYGSIVNCWDTRFWAAISTVA